MTKVKFQELLSSRNRNIPLVMMSTVIIIINGLRIVICTQAMATNPWWPLADGHLGTWKSHTKMFPRFHGQLWDLPHIEQLSIKLIKQKRQERRISTVTTFVNTAVT